MSSIPPSVTTDKSESPNATSKSNQQITLTMIIAAFKLYRIKAMSCETSKDFRLPASSKQIWIDPLIKIYETAQARAIDCVTSYTKRQLLNIIAKYEPELKRKLSSQIYTRGNHADENKLIRKLEVIYYTIVFDNRFRGQVYATFESSSLDKDIMILDNDKGARVTQGILTYPGNTCIEEDCKGELSMVYYNHRQDSRGSLAMVYHKNEAPKICAIYQKICTACQIYYNYNRIDYAKITKTKKQNKKPLPELYTKYPSKINQTILLDPTAFPYFTASLRSQNVIHKSIFDSIKHHQYCTKSTSMDVWLQHYNEEWIDAYKELHEIAKSKRLPIELGYKTVLRYFYFHTLLHNIQGLKHFGTVSVNGREIKIALIISDKDKTQMLQDQVEANDDDDKEYRESLSYFKFYFNKYCQQLLTAEISELSQVPVQFKNGKIIIYPGWFVLYGDGGEKITRVRCSYPAICCKYDYIVQMLLDDADEKVNEIGEDDNIDLATHNNSKLYSKQRYYECDNTPQYNKEENAKKSYKTCKYHTAKLQDHGIPLDEIRSFCSWYQLHTAVARIDNTNVSETMKVQYSFDEEVINSIKTKQKKKRDELTEKIASFKQSHPERHLKFKKLIEQMHDKITNHSSGNDKKKARSRRKSYEEAQNKIFIQVDGLNTQEIYEQISAAVGDDDIDDGAYNMTTSVRDLLDLEFNNNKYLDKYKGCRKSHYISKATTSRTKGLNVLMNCAGIIICLREEIVRETPTAVILDIADACTNNPTAKQYSNRIEAIGYDMMCRMYHHLKTLVDEDRLSANQETFWCDLMERAFIDIWHIYTHTDDLCKEDGAFHPRLGKFKEILYDDNGDGKYRVNDIIAEQFWAGMNSTCQLKSMNKETFMMFLLEKRAYHNRAKIAQIKKDGWKFVPIKWFTSLRDVDAKKAKSLSTQTLLIQNRDKKLQRVHVKSEHVQDVIKLFPSQTQNKNIPRKRKRTL